MRRPFAGIVEKLALEDDRIIFISGDLGFNALENLQQSLGDRFINAGVAEQNMIGVAAGLAYKGYSVFCYSIAPFITYRCLEQIRIDVCFHKLPVFIVGNGGGYGYGIMGATHHALEDIACISSLPGMACHIPAFAEDVEISVKQIMDEQKPAYLRLGLAKTGAVQKRSAGMNTVFSSNGSRLTILVMGPVIHHVLEAVDEKLKQETDLFSAVKLPMEDAGDFFSSMQKTGKLLVVEEHVARGGLAEHVALQLHSRNIQVKRLKSLHALGYPEDLYGDQLYHQTRSGLDSTSIRKQILACINE